MLPGLTPQQRQYLYELHNKSVKEVEKNFEVWFKDYDYENEASYVYERELERAWVYAELGGFPLNDFVRRKLG